MYQPRGSLARALYEKCITDEKLKELDKNQVNNILQFWYIIGFNIQRHIKWYAITPCFLPSLLRTTFLQLSLDEETQFFLNQSITKSSWVFTQVWDCLLKTFLNFFMTQTSINGLLRRGSMFVFSKSQFLQLTSWNENFLNVLKPKLLDLGAGDGVVTSVISQLFDEVFVTEVSPTMKWILAEKGFRILNVENWESQPVKFEVITCLNLLDRCDRPIDILLNMKKVLQPGGLVILAMVLPFKPYVEVGNRNHAPSQVVDIDGCTFEEQVASVAKNLLQPTGYEIMKWSRLPYLCEGDLKQSFYWLDDVVFVLKLPHGKN